MPKIINVLPLYRQARRKYLKEHGRWLNIAIPLTERFRTICEHRIVEGAKKYGDDWKEKDCLKELEFEKYDIFNYLLLNECQKAYKARTAKNRK